MTPHCYEKSIAWADFQAGWDAYNRGGYEADLKEFRLAAGIGDTGAQCNLGVMYDEGQGVTISLGSSFSAMGHP